MDNKRYKKKKAIIEWKKKLLLTFMSVNHMSINIFNWNESLLFTFHRIHGKARIKWKKSENLSMCLNITCLFLLWTKMNAKDVFLQFSIFFLIILNTIYNHFKALNEILFCFLIFYFFGHLQLWTSIYVYSMPYRLSNCVLCLKRIKQTQNVRNNNENKSFFVWYMILWTEHIYDLIVLLFVAYCVAAKI